jgi:hypothetical protein
MFQPVIPLSGIGGWRFLQATYDRQLASYSDSPQVRADRNYLIGKLSQPMTTEEFLDDPRLLRVAMTAFDLSGEEWKKGFISKALKEAADPESTFLARLNNPQYTAFAQTFAATDGKIELTEEIVQQIAANYNTAAFELSVGEVDDTMRLALNYQSEIKRIAGSGSSETTILYRILGDTPVRTLIEGATGLPQSIRSLDIDQQAEMLKSALQKSFGINNVADLASDEKVDKVVQRYHAMQSLSSTTYAPSSAANALTLLNGGLGLSGQSALNLFLSGQ